MWTRHLQTVPQLSEIENAPRLLDRQQQWHLFAENTEVQLQLLLTFLPMMSPDHGALCKFNAGFRAARLVSFVGLPPNSWSSVFERNAELRLIREDNSRPLSNCPVALLRGPSQPLLALLKIQERLHPWYAVGVAHCPFPLFCDRLLIVMQAHHQRSTVGQFPCSSEIGPTVPVSPASGHPAWW